MFRILNGQMVNFVALAVVGGLFYAAYLMHLSPNDHQTWAWMLSVAIALSFFAASFNYWRLLKITEAPISTIAAAAQGYIELHGSAKTAKPFKTPFQGIPCVWYRSWVYADRYDATNKTRETRLIEYVESDEVFQLSDDSGTCMVNPKGAEIIYMQKRTQHKNDHRYVEEYLPSASELYVLGHLDTRHHFNTTEALHQDTGKLLASWKVHPSKLLQRFDSNRNGEIDMHEWELARMEARREVEMHHQMRAHNETYTLAKPKNGQLFLISALSPHALRKQYQCWSILHLALLVILLIVYQKLA
jgi:hypothetical protein